MKMVCSVLHPIICIADSRSLASSRTVLEQNNCRSTVFASFLMSRDICASYSSMDLVYVLLDHVLRLWYLRAISFTTASRFGHLDGLWISVRTTALKGFQRGGPHRNPHDRIKKFGFFEHPDVKKTKCTEDGQAHKVFPAQTEALPNTPPHKRSWRKRIQT